MGSHLLDYILVKGDHKCINWFKILNLNTEIYFNPKSEYYAPYNSVPTLLSITIPMAQHCVRIINPSKQSISLTLYDKKWELRQWIKFSFLKKKTLRKIGQLILAVIDNEFKIPPNPYFPIISLIIIVFYSLFWIQLCEGLTSFL